MSWPKVALLSLCLAIASFAGAAQVSSPAAEAKEKRDLAVLKQDHDRAEKAWRKQPKNAKLKNQYVFSTVKLGMHTMYAVALPPKQKYPEALRLFKEALKVDPSNKDARTAKDQIEAVYRSMNERKKG
jgi:hypothetical protein